MKKSLLTIRLLLESFVFALKSVIVNRLRTILSLLGITIGIFAIISVFTIFDSLEINIRDSLAEAGENVIYIQKWPWAPEDGEEYAWWQYWNRPVPKYKEYELIKETSILSEAVCFWAFTGRLVKYKNNSVSEASIWGTSQEYEDTREHEIERGRFFTPYEFEASRNLAVIGATYADELFQNEDPLGKEIKIKGHKATVIGVFEREGNSMLGGGSLDEFIVIPMQFMRKITDIRREGAQPMILARARPGVSNEDLKEELRLILRASRRLKPRADDNFALNQTSMFTSALDGIFKVLNLTGFFYRDLFYPCGRVWDRQYHVCICQGAYQYHRDTESPGSQAVFYPLAVPFRIHAPDPLGRHHRTAYCLCRYRGHD